MQSKNVSRTNPPSLLCLSRETHLQFWLDFCEFSVILAKVEMSCDIQLWCLKCGGIAHWQRLWDGKFSMQPFQTLKMNYALLLSIVQCKHVILDLGTKTLALHAKYPWFHHQMKRCKVTGVWRIFSAQDHVAQSQQYRNWATVQS